VVVASQDLETIRVVFLEQGVEETFGLFEGGKSRDQGFARSGVMVMGDAVL
jgi:hypothetical protein